VIGEGNLIRAYETLAGAMELAHRRLEELMRMA
jgi:hypothetical protein